MPRKKKTVIETEIDDNEQPIEILDPPGIPADEDTLNFFDQFPNSKKVSIYRLDKMGRQAYVGTLPPGGFSAETVQQNFGGGEFIVRLRDESGRILTNRQMIVEAPPSSSPQPATTANGEAALKIQLDLLREQLARQQELVLHIVDRPAGAGDGLKGIIEAVGTLRTLADPGNQVQGIVSALTEGLKLGMKSQNPGGEDKISGILRIVEKVSEIAPRLFPARSPAGGLQPPPGDGSQVPVSGQFSGGAETGILRGAIQYLKTKIGKSPEFWADWIADNVDEAHWLELMKLVEKPYDEVTKILGDPELAQEPYKTWFTKLLSELKEIIRNDAANQDPERTSGNVGGAG